MRSLCIPCSFLLLVSTACSDEVPAPKCAGLDQRACEASPECRPILGGPAAEYCVGDLSNWNTVYAGCTAIDQGCGDAETCASDPATGQRLYFADTCVPDGWLPCDCTVPATCESGGDLTPAGQICVRGISGIAGESIAPNEPIRLEVTPAGCFGSGCVNIYDSVCQAALAGTEITVSSLFCIGDAGSDACLPDCGGAGYATCYSEGLPDGTYTVNAGGLSVTFTVPSSVPFGGECAGNPPG